MAAKGLSRPFAALVSGDGASDHRLTEQPQSAKKMKDVRRIRDERLFFHSSFLNFQIPEADVVESTIIKHLGNRGARRKLRNTTYKNYVVFGLTLSRPRAYHYPAFKKIQTAVLIH
jgi:hypothetical protein